MDFLMEAFQAGGELFSCVSLREENTPRTSRQTPTLHRCLQAMSPGEEREKEHSKAELATWPVTAARSPLSLDLHFTHKAAFEFVN